MADDYGVTWFEEPVSSDDLAGLRQVRTRFAADVAAGEYGYTLDYFASMLDAGAVDCLQADVTRCGGYTVWLTVAALAAAHHLQSLRALRPQPPRPCRRVGPQPAPRRVLPRPPPHRDHALRRDAAAHRGRHDARSIPGGHGLALREADAAPYRVA